MSFDEVRTWVQAARSQLREERSQVSRDDVAKLHGQLDGECLMSSPAPYALVPELVHDLENPTEPAEISALGDLVACLQERWQLVRPRGGRG